ncbi:MAG: alpha/beta hydrolase [Saprospiraceae bacterium]|nr:alpha/beta hydrolase [Lewinella sp.]
MAPILHIPVIVLAAIILLSSGLALFRLRQPTSMPLWMMKVYTSAISPILLVAAALLVFIGWEFSSLTTMLLGGTGALIYWYHIVFITRASETETGFTAAFGPQWEEQFPPKVRDRFLAGRYVLQLPKVADPVFEQDLVFYTLPGTDRHLLCDIWQPPNQISRSGLALIYLHGSAWTLLDKDFGTRTFFRHLTNQGHVVMDVAYRLFPETDMMGMVHDAKHAIAWLKAQAEVYQIDPERMVIAGGSAGGHIALLAAYTDQNDQFTPDDLAGKDLSVQSVISLYGPTDLSATYYHTAQHLNSKSALSQGEEHTENGRPSWMEKKMGANFKRLGFDKKVEPGMLAPTLGGTPDDVEEIYRLFSPLTHVHEACPPTLLIQGEHDIIVPVRSNIELYERLHKAGIPAVLHLLPQCDHAFDLILPKISPSAQNAYYDIERFLYMPIFKPVG